MNVPKKQKSIQFSTATSHEEADAFREKTMKQAGMKPYTFLRLFIKAYNRGDIRIVFEAKAGESILSRKI